MPGRGPQEIWDESVGEGERRVDRTVSGLLATGVVGGVDVMLGILALVLVTAGVEKVAAPETAHVAGSLVFGIGFVFIVIGRSELFTENFLVPVSTVMHGRRGIGSLLKLWGLTLVGNVVGLLVLGAIFTRAGVLPESTLGAASKLAETFADRDWVAALLSGVLGGVVMTLLTWLVHATQDSTAKVLVALSIGFLLAAPSLNHAVVSFGEMSYGIMAGRGHAGWLDLAQNFPLAAVGNLAGGLGLVTAMRLVQARGEPG